MTTVPRFESGSKAPNEEERLAAVRRFDILDSPPDGSFDRITALAARHFDVPISIVTIVDRDRIWFKSHHGIDVTEIGRDPGLCASAIMQEDLWIVGDAALDPRTLANPLVAGEFGLRFYAGAPLTTADGFNLGTLCIIDREPRELTTDETESLRDLARVVMDELELRLAARRLVDQQHALRDQAEYTARELQASLIPPRLPEIPGASLASLYLPASTDEVGGDFYDVFELGDSWVLVIGDVSGKGPRAASLTAQVRYAVRAAALAGPDPSAILETVNRALLLGRGATELESYSTVAVAILRPAGEGFDVVAAAGGHPPALVVRKDGSVEQLETSGSPVGWHGDAVFATAALALHSGDAVILYTDGLTEARSQGGLLGVEGITTAVVDGGTADELAARLLGALTGDGVRVHDDAAAIVLSVA